jgi:DNA mismatch repair protein MutS
MKQTAATIVHATDQLQAAHCKFIKTHIFVFLDTCQRSDISTGEFLTAEGPFDYVDKLLNNFAPKEILFERGKRGMFEGNFGSKFFTFELDDWVFTESSSREKLLKHFETKNLKGFGVEHLKNGIIASGAILQYLDMTEHTQVGHITSLARIEEDKYVRLDKFTVRKSGYVSRRW